MILSQATYIGREYSFVQDCIITHRAETRIEVCVRGIAP